MVHNHLWLPPFGSARDIGSPTSRHYSMWLWSLRTFKKHAKNYKLFLKASFNSDRPDELGELYTCKGTRLKSHSIKNKYRET